MPAIHIPALSLSQMKLLEQRMEQSYHIDPLQSMENAGRSLALLTKRLLDNDLSDRPVIVLAGAGRKGAIGLAAARHLLNWGAWVQVLCAFPLEMYQGVPLQQVQALQAAGISLAWAEEGWELPPSDLAIDAIDFGMFTSPEDMYEPEELIGNLIALANSSLAPVLSIGIPAGVDATTGQSSARSIQADATLSIALPLSGVLVEPGMSLCGELYLGDTGVPGLLLEEIGIDLPSIFAHDTLLALSIVDGRAYADG